MHRCTKKRRDQRKERIYSRYWGINAIHLVGGGRPAFTDDPAILSAKPSTCSSSLIPPSDPPNTPWMSDIVLSKLLLRVLGLVIVVPRLACLECPLLNPPGDVLVGENADEGGVGAGAVLIFPGVTFFSNPAATPFDVTGSGATSAVSAGVVGCEMMALPSSEAGSNKSGGKRSFSISALRASSNPLIASLIPSVPKASVPYGSLLDPDTLLSSDTFSDSL